MKDYLKEELSQEEKLILVGLIWKVSKKFKMKFYEENTRICELYDSIDIVTEDTYKFNEISFKMTKGEIRPINDEEKCNIVMGLDCLLREVCLYKLIGTLTFNEKLVFFLYYMEGFKNKEVATMLNNTEKTIEKRRVKIDYKINELKGLN